jgi:hypothetical protein
MNQPIVSFRFENLHPALLAAITGLGADSVKVLEAVNAELGELKLEVEATNKDSEKADKITFTSKFKAASNKNTATPALRLARIQRWLCESAELFLRVETVTLPKSIAEWVMAKKFQAAPEPAPESGK